MNPSDLIPVWVSNTLAGVIIVIFLLVINISKYKENPTEYKPLIYIKYIKERIKRAKVQHVNRTSNRDISDSS